MKKISGCAPVWLKNIVTGLRAHTYSPNPAKEAKGSGPESSPSPIAQLLDPDPAYTQGPSRICPVYAWTSPILPRNRANMPGKCRKYAKNTEK